MDKCTAVQPSGIHVMAPRFTPTEREREREKRGGNKGVGGHWEEKGEGGRERKSNALRAGGAGESLGQGCRSPQEGNRTESCSIAL